MLFARLAVITCLLFTTLCHADGADKIVPPALSPWQQWVLRDQLEHACPRIAQIPSQQPVQQDEQRRCRWPGALTIEADNQGARFAQQWQLFADGWLTLPGDASHWPAQVLINGAPAAVLERDGYPAVHVTAGTHQLSGQLHWSTPPQYLAIAADTALIALRVNDKPRAAAIDDGRLWLNGQQANGATENDSLKVEVFRRLDDGVPMQLVTELRLAVSGRPRELVLGQLLADGAEPVSFSSPLPARIEPDGRLRIQARAGEWRIALTARFADAPSEFSIKRADDLWPEQEIWSFRANPSLRGVKLEGVPAVDPSQLDLSADFANLPTFLMTVDSHLRLSEQYRGDAHPAPHQLSLNRSLWLDFDGRGATAKDSIRGTFGGDWRLRTQAGLDLGRLSVNGEPQLVTRLPGKPATGVEVRHATAVVEAISRIEPLTALTAAGWDAELSRVNVALQLPPGWQLWHAAGPDQVQASWLSSWNLWDLFLCLLIVAAVGRVLGLVWGLAAAATLALTYQVAGAPVLGWAALVGTLALLRELPAGRLRQWTRIFAMLALITVATIILAFAVQQARRGLYPQLEQERAINAAYYDAVSSGAMAPATAPAKFAADSALDSPPMVEKSDLKRKSNNIVTEPAPRYRPTDNVQTGPGEPSWHWREVRLTWSGPVAADAPLALYLSPPWLTRLLSVLQIILVGLLFVALARALLPVLKTDKSANGGHSDTSTAIAGLLPLVVATALVSATGLLWSPHSRADEFPPQPLLDELRSHLLQAPDCAPDCAALEQVRVELVDDQLRLYLRAAAGTEVALPLPLHASWRPLSVLRDGAPTTLARDGGQLWVQLPAGSHDLLLVGTAAGDTIALPFPLPPHNLTVTAPDWEVQGLADGQIVGQSLQLQRRQRGDTANQLLPTPIKAFVRVERQFDLDIDWQLTTTVTRIAPANGAISLRLPLLAGEAVVSEGLTVAGREVVVAMNAQQAQYQWRSVMTPQDAVTLSAPTTDQWVEEWRINPSPRWHLAGLSLPSIKTDSANPALTRVWRPWPGESLTLSAVKPEPVPGPTTTVERATLDYQPGTSGAALALRLQIRTSLGGDYALQLPPSARLLRLSIDGVEQTRPADSDGTVVIPLHPGLQSVDLQSELPAGVGLRTRTPAIALATTANNIELRLALPESRWPLFTRGPAIGPAMLYWGVLVVIIGVAIGLGIAVKRAKLSIPVNTGQWLLLAIGMSTVNSVGSVAVVAWFFAMEARRRQVPARWFNLIQLGLITLSILAATSLLYTIPQSLLAAPDMQVTGNGSSNYFYQWYQDHSGASLPRGEVLSVPLWVYRVAMLLWSLWLAFALIDWMRWGWRCFASGKLWESKPTQKASPVADSSTVPEPQPESR